MAGWAWAELGWWAVMLPAGLLVGRAAWWGNHSR